MTDWGSWDEAFNRMTASVCRDILAIVDGVGSHVCVPLQGSGTFSVEAALGTLVPKQGKVLVPNNGAYCQRILRILSTLGREAIALPVPENEAVDPEQIDRILTADPTITHVALVHCETSAGILNPLSEIAALVARQGRRLIVDAMSSFGVLPINVKEMAIEAVIAASGKCLEGVPGMGFVIAQRSALEAASGNCHSLAMDLHDQWCYMERTGQWRFTPPTHVVAALRCALDQYLTEGGREARLRRYAENCATLVSGMRALGLQTFIADAIQAPIIVTFLSPSDPAYDFSAFYTRVREKGFILYPGKLTSIDTFRVGCIGAIDAVDIVRALAAVKETLEEMGVSPLRSSQS